MAAELKVSLRRKEAILDTLKKDLNPHDWQIVKEILEDSIRRGIVTIADDAPPES